MLKIHMKLTIIYSYAKDPYEIKYHFLINKWESTSLKHLNDSKAFIEYWNDMDDICKNIEYNPNNKRKILIVFGNVNTDMLSNKKNLLCCAKKKKNRLNSKHYFIMKIPNKWELQQFADICFKDFMNLYKNVLQNHILF